MIISNWHRKQRMGNHMWQYVASRKLATELGYKLSSPSIPGFPNTAFKVEGEEHLNPTYNVHFNNLNMNVLRELSVGGARFVFYTCLSDYKFIATHKNIIRDDWLYFHQPYKTDLSLLKGHFKKRDGSDLKGVEVRDISKQDLVVNVRLGDYLQPKHSWRICDFNYFSEILKHVKFERVFIVSDEVLSPLLYDYAKKYDAIYYISKGGIEDLNFIRLFNKIVCSYSTFCWWGTYLSDATEIYYPMFEPVVGWIKNGVEDTMVNEDRYIYTDRDSRKIIGNYSEARKFYNVRS